MDSRLNPVPPEARQEGMADLISCNTITYFGSLSMGILLYFIKETFRGFFQAKLMTSVSIVTVTFTLFFIGCVLISVINIKQWLDKTSKQASIVIYFEDWLINDSVQFDNTMNKIKLLPQVASVVYVSKEQAWKNMETMYGATILEAVDENPLPASLEITVNTKTPHTITTELKQYKGIEGVRYSKQWHDTLKNFNRVFIIASVIIGIGLLLVLNTMISNTIKLTIYARKDLITNMHYVGATDFYIKTPFILEGVLQGIIGSILSICCIFFLRFLMMINDFNIYWGGWNMVVILIFLGGILSGYLGSMNAVRRFLV